MAQIILTAESIWRAFEGSGKRHLILTGSKGSGKTTLLSSLFPAGTPGLTSWAVPRQAVFLKGNCSGEQVQAAVFDGRLPGPGNQMVLLEQPFLSFGIPALERCARSPAPWVTLDEIGYLEAQCGPYQGAVEALFEKKQVCAVVRKQELPFLTALCKRPDVFLVDLDEPFGALGCVIMASGLGKRFGGNKLLADFGGQPLICAALDATQGLFRQRVLVTRHRDVAALGRERGIPTVLHHLPYRSDTVRLGLEALPGVERCMFLAGDQPKLRRETLAALALAAQKAPDYFWRTRWQDTPGSPVVFPRWSFPQLLALPQGKGGGVVVQKYPERLKTVAVRDEYELKDVDTPEDLQALLELSSFP